MKCDCVCEKRESFIHDQCVHEMTYIYTYLCKHRMSNKWVLNVVKPRKLKESNEFIFMFIELDLF